MIGISKLKCFHPTGKGEPVAINYTRGGYWYEVLMNKKKLTVPGTQGKASAVIVPMHHMLFTVKTLHKALLKTSLPDSACPPHTEVLHWK